MIRSPAESSCSYNHMFTVFSGKANQQLGPVDFCVIVAGHFAREKEKIKVF